MQLAESTFKSLSCARRSPRSRWAGESHHQVQRAMADKFLQVHAYTLPSGSKGRNSSSPTQTGLLRGEAALCSAAKEAWLQTGAAPPASHQHPPLPQTHCTTRGQHNASINSLAKTKAGQAPQSQMVPIASPEHTLLTPRENPDEKLNKIPENLEQSKLYFTCCKLETAHSPSTFESEQCPDKAVDQCCWSLRLWGYCFTPT